MIHNNIVFKALLIIAVLLAILLLWQVKAKAGVLDDINFDIYMLYGLGSHEISLAPGSNLLLIADEQKIFKGNICVAFPLDIEEPNVIFGPGLDISLNKSLAALTGWEWVSSKSIDIGASVMVDALSITHKELKELTYLSLHLRILTP